MAAIGETTTALSHSIKNILQALRGGADVVEMGLKGNKSGEMSVSNALTALIKGNQVTRRDRKYVAA